MSYQVCSEVLRDACALTLRDEPLVGRVEHGPMQLWVEVAQLCIPLHHPVHSEVREQPTRRWQSRTNNSSRTPCSGTSRSAALDFSSLTSFGLMLTNLPLVG